MTTSTLAAASEALDDLLRGKAPSDKRRRSRKKTKRLSVSLKQRREEEEEDGLDPEEVLKRRAEDQRKVQERARKMMNSSKLKKAEIEARKNILAMREEKFGKKKKGKGTKRKVAEAGVDNDSD